MAIRPPREDLYRELGVDPSASADDLAAAFRTLAKELHPDARPHDEEAGERFKRVSLAYSVLGDPARRAGYDAEGVVVAPSPTVTRPPTPVDASANRAGTGHRRLGRRGARWALGGGVVLVALGIVAGAWVLALQRRDADLRKEGVAAVATVVARDGQRRLEFTTRSGDRVQAVEATKSGGNQADVGSTVRLHYDPDDPSRIVVDASHTARDVTLWIVAVKFLVGGAILVVVGARRLRDAGARAG